MKKPLFPNATADTMWIIAGHEGPVGVHSLAAMQHQLGIGWFRGAFAISHLISKGFVESFSLRGELHYRVTEKGKQI